MAKKPTFIDLFAGAGGLSLGFKKAGYEHLLGVEMDPRMATTYERNIGKVLVKDVTKVKMNELPYADVIIGGVPCEGFSPANRKVWNERKSDPRQKLIFDFARIVNAKKPKMFLMENASSLAGKRFKDTHLAKFVKQLSPLYNVKCEIKDLGKIAGIPQRRKRTICIGQKK